MTIFYFLSYGPREYLNFLWAAKKRGRFCNFDKVQGGEKQSKTKVCGPSVSLSRTHGSKRRFSWGRTSDESEGGERKKSLNGERRWIWRMGQRFLGPSHRGWRARKIFIFHFFGFPKPFFSTTTTTLSSSPSSFLFFHHFHFFLLSVSLTPTIANTPPRSSDFDSRGSFFFFSLLSSSPQLLSPSGALSKNRPFFRRPCTSFFQWHCQLRSFFSSFCSLYLPLWDW